MTQAQENNDTIVVEVPGPGTYGMQQAIFDMFPEERDPLLAKMTDIRDQVDRFETIHDADVDPPGYLRIGRQEAFLMADLLDQLANNTRYPSEVQDTAENIRQQARETPEQNPDLRIMRATRFGWAEAIPSCNMPNSIIVMIPNQDGLLHRARFQEAILGTTPQGELICLIDTDDDLLRQTLEEIPTGTERLFKTRIKNDQRLQLLEVLPEPEST